MVKCSDLSAALVEGVDYMVIRSPADNLYHATQALADHCRRSLNVGPLTRRPDREARLWLAVRKALQEYTDASKSTNSNQALIATLLEALEAVEPILGRGYAPIEEYDLGLKVRAAIKRATEE